MITVSERYESRITTSGTNPSAELRYTVQGTTSEVEARTAVLAVNDGTYDLWGNGTVILHRESISTEVLGPDSWLVSVVYSRLPPAGTFETEFDTGGETVHIDRSITTRARFAPAGKTPPNHNGLIRVTADGVEGADIISQKLSFSETHLIDGSAINNAYLVVLRNLTGTVNQYPFRGFEAEEVLFVGARGQRRADGVWNVSYSFLAGANVVEPITIATITGITYKAHDLVWVEVERREDDAAKRIIVDPIAVHVEQVYKIADWSQLILNP